MMRTLAPRLWHALHTAFRLSGSQWAALWHAALWTALTRAALVVVPWGRISAASRQQKARPGPPDWARARLVLWAVAAVARRVLPARPCLTQALVAQRLLRRHGVETDLVLGAARVPGKAFQAHAWLEHEGRTVIGHVDTEVPYTAFRPVSRAAAPAGR